MYTNLRWASNIGHALWDGLYPAYLALVKFGYMHSPFVLLTENLLDDNSLAYEVAKALCGNSGGDSVESLGALQQRGTFIHFKKLIAGCGGTGIKVIDENFALYGRQYDALQAFKRRIYAAYSLQVDAPPQATRQCIIINNKRFTERDHDLFMKIIAYYRPTLDIRFIKWRVDYSNFGEQLKQIATTDIHVTGPGTGMMYMPFLKRGAVNVNLGRMLGYESISPIYRPRLDGRVVEVNDIGAICPSWMEQTVCAGCDYVKTLYYDRFAYNELEFWPLRQIIGRAFQYINSKQEQKNIPADANINIDARVFKTYIRQAKNRDEICEFLTCNGIFIEKFVNEWPSVVFPRDNFVDIKLLREIKAQLNFDRRYEAGLQIQLPETSLRSAPET